MDIASLLKEVSFYKVTSDSDSCPKLVSNSDSFYASKKSRKKRFPAGLEPTSVITKKSDDSKDDDDNSEGPVKGFATFIGNGPITVTRMLNNQSENGKVMMSKQSEDSNSDSTSTSDGRGRE